MTSKLLCILWKHSKHDHYVQMLDAFGIEIETIDTFLMHLVLRQKIVYSWNLGVKICGILSHRS